MDEVIWEGIDGEQPLLPGFTSAPTIAECAFLTLAREWNAAVTKCGRELPLPREVDIHALACLLLAVEWGDAFSSDAERQIDLNYQLAGARGFRSWMDELLWQLCRAGQQDAPATSPAVESLTANLDHHNSSIRMWMMEMAWFVHRWLNPHRAVKPLLDNVAVTLFGPFEAAGLAARFFASDDEFLAFARTSTQPSPFEEQYRSRIDFVADHGVAETQTAFWQLECQVRQGLERTALSLRLSRNPTRG